MRTGPISLHARLLQPAWDRLPEPLRRLHSTVAPDVIQGRFEVRQGTNPFSRWLAWLLNLPRAKSGYALRLTIQPRDQDEVWVRRFDERSLTTVQSAGPDGCLHERFGMFEFTFRVEAGERTITHTQTAVALRVGGLKVPLPPWLAPRVIGSESVSPDDQEVHVQVEVHVPVLGVLLAYRGTVLATDRLSA